MWRKPTLIISSQTWQPNAHAAHLSGKRLNMGISGAAAGIKIACKGRSCVGVRGPNLGVRDVERLFHDGV